MVFWLSSEIFKYDLLHELLHEVPILNNTMSDGPLMCREKKRPLLHEFFITVVLFHVVPVYATVYCTYIFIFKKSKQELWNMMSWGDKIHILLSVRCIHFIYTDFSNVLLAFWSLFSKTFFTASFLKQVLLQNLHVVYIIHSSFCCKKNGLSLMM